MSLSKSISKFGLPKNGWFGALNLFLSTDAAINSTIWDEPSRADFSWNVLPNSSYQAEIRKKQIIFNATNLWLLKNRLLYSWSQHKLFFSLLFWYLLSVWRCDFMFTKLITFIPKLLDCLQAKYKEQNVGFFHFNFVWKHPSHFLIFLIWKTLLPDRLNCEFDKYFPVLF